MNLGKATSSQCYSIASRHPIKKKLKDKEKRKRRKKKAKHPEFGSIPVIFKDWLNIIGKAQFYMFNVRVMAGEDYDFTYRHFSWQTHNILEA